MAQIGPNKRRIFETRRETDVAKTLGIYSLQCLLSRNCSTSASTSLTLIVLSTGRIFSSVNERPRSTLHKILTTNLAECVCVCAKCDPFLPLRFHFFFKLPEFFFRIAKFPYAAFGPLFAFHCPIFFTKNNTLNGVCMLNVTAAH